MKNLSSLGRNLTKEELKLINGGNYLPKERFSPVYSRSGAPGAGVTIRVRGIGSTCC